MQFRFGFALILTLAAFPSVTPGQNQPVTSYPLNSYVRYLDGQWEGIRYASDGNVYFASSSQSAHHGAAFFKYNPTTQQLTMLAEDITTICGEDPQINPQGKIHANIQEMHGWLFFTTHFGADDRPNGVAGWTGGHLVGYRFADTGSNTYFNTPIGGFHDYGVIYPGSPGYTSYSGIAVDPAQNYIYVIATGEVAGQVSYVFRYKAATDTQASRVNLGAVYGTFGASLYWFVDPSGDVWFAVFNDNGALHRIHHDTGSIDRYDNVLPPLVRPDSNTVNPSFDRAIQWMAPIGGAKAVFTYNGGGMLYQFDSSQTTSGSVPAAAFTNIQWIGPSYIGSAVGDNRVFWYQRAGGAIGYQGCNTPDTTLPPACQDYHLMSLSLDAATGYAITDHGLLVDQSGRTVWRIPSMITDGTNNNVYMVGDWWTYDTNRNPIPGDDGVNNTQRYHYAAGLESYINEPRGEFFAAAHVTVGSPGSVTVTPPTVTLGAGHTKQFTANQPVTWLLNPVVGSLSSAGAYQAPTTIASSQTITVTATSTANPSKSGTATITLQPQSSATVQFVQTDTATQGTWRTSYGADGFNVLGDVSAYPTYAAVAQNGQSFWQWAASTSDVRALKKSAASDRVAATSYSSTNFSIDVNLVDGLTHQLALYSLDWDKAGRTQTFTLLDAITGAVLDTRSIAAFTNGIYLVWSIHGHVTIKVTNTGPKNAVVSGIFFGGGAAPPPPSSNAAQFVKTDSTTMGNWKSRYGGDGFNVLGDTAAYPSYATVTPNGQQYWSWASSTVDSRALQKNAASDRTAAAWYSSTNFSIDLNLTGGQSRQVAIYCVDWDNSGRTQTMDLFDAQTGALLDSRGIAAYNGGEYVVWNITGHVTLKITRTGGKNGVVSGIFFGSAPVPVVTTSTAQFVKLDGATQGNWKGVYGLTGYNVFGDAVAYPAYAVVLPGGTSQWTWAASTPDVRALQKGAGSDRIASAWYSATNFTIDVKLTDGQEHQIALYCLDWENAGRAQTFDILDAGSGLVLDSRSTAAFSKGQYLLWNIRGHVIFRMTSSGAKNAVVSGIFF